MKASNLFKLIIIGIMFFSTANAGVIYYGFSPGGSAQKLILYSINTSTKSIDIAAYSFTSKDIALALLNAKKRGVEIRVLADYKANEKYTVVGFLRNAGVDVRVNNNYEIMHNKFMVIDNENVQTGSFNYTASANKRNAENVIYIKDNKALASGYQKEFERLFKESE
ncbi:phospholipase D family protein [Pantoea agglomerans]|uniref:phospholipase D family nuclease n=1 Tax=Enterobacter agglomerans TaxID=549 RepID=UPI0016548329|nr:phospholipase D family protein [Pantoea agglomerans]